MSFIAPKASIKDFFFQTIIYGFGLAISKTINFILLPIYTNYFSPEELGIYNLVFSLWVFMMVIYSLGLETSFLKFFIEKNDDSSKTAIYSTAITGTVLTSVAFSLILFFFSDNIAVLLSTTSVAEASRLIKLMSFAMLFDLLSRFPLLLLKSNMRAKTFFIINSIFFVSNLILNIVFIIFLDYGIEAIFYSYIISSVLSLTIGLFVTKSFLLKKFSIKLFEKMLRFGSSFILMGMFLIIIEQSDKFFLNFYFGESVVGIYSTCYRLGSIMLLAIMAFKISWTPYFLNISKDSANKKIISEVFTYFIFAGLFMFLFFYLFLDDIVKANIFGIEIINEKYWGGLKIIPVVLLSYFFSGLYMTLSVIPLFTGKPVYLFWITLCGCTLNLISNIILIPKFEMNGAAYATLVSYVFMFGALYLISQQHYYIKYDWKKIYAMSLLTIIVCIINYLFSNSPYIVILNIILLSVFFGLLNLLKIIQFKKLKTLFIKRQTGTI